MIYGILFCIGTALMAIGVYNMVPPKWVRLIPAWGGVLSPQSFAATIHHLIRIDTLPEDLDRFKGKTVRLVCSVLSNDFDRDRGPGMVMLSFDIGGRNIPVLATFLANHREFAHGLREGEDVSIQGEVDAMELGRYRPSQSVLLKSCSPRRSRR